MPRQVLVVLGELTRNESFRLALLCRRSTAEHCRGQDDGRSGLQSRRQLKVVGII